MSNTYFWKEWFLVTLAMMVLIHEITGNINSYMYVTGKTMARIKDGIIKKQSKDM